MPKWYQLLTFDVADNVARCSSNDLNVDVAHLLRDAHRSERRDFVVDERARQLAVGNDVLRERDEGG